MSSYIYSYDDFRRDLDAVNVPLNSKPHDFMDCVALVFRYCDATYKSKTDRLERGSTLMKTFLFLAEHSRYFDEHAVAVRSDSDRGLTFVSDHLLRAVYQIVVPFSLGATEQEPTPEAVVRLAKEYEK
jgi:hypothetical protein